MTIDTFINTHRLPSGFKTIVTEHFIPLAKEIVSHHGGAKIPYFVGINGCQGSGKSTLSEFLKSYIEAEFSMKVVIMSLDDFYYSQADRSILARDVHPLFQTRGVPGTHDTQLAKTALQNLKANHLPVTIPRFNKATDNPFPKKEWTQLDSTVDIVIFEGWCWGVEAQEHKALATPVNLMEERKDSLGLWRNYINNQLNIHYKPLYQFMDLWVMFKAPSFDDVYTWRLEQEQKLITSLEDSGDKQKANGVMNPQQILDFIQHYQRLTEHCLDTLPAKCNHVFELDKDRNIIAHVKSADKVVDNIGEVKE
ncbi:kinase [Paraglaciecola aquimarina]|uniref:Kinase n=1 Tax=Paraglaciecola algarum TaxID=3050085 RepID=A0ABS9D9C7_9ALTE|nr:kinase [Paraglaciecola sp. G1-23]MCF2948992.1 kinase [Paraglaciecola sp. G1-23]